MMLLFGLFIIFGGVFQCQGEYYGTFIGNFQTFAHSIAGTVYAVSDDAIFIKGFVYDGTGPDAFFWTGVSPRPEPRGTLIPYPEVRDGRDAAPLKRFESEDILLKLPPGTKVRDLRWLSVWCRRFTVDFGSLLFPPNIEPPMPQTLPEFKRFAHGVRSGNVTILDEKTIYIPNLHYDGEGPDAFFWVGNGTSPNPEGIKVANEVGSFDLLRSYHGEDIEIQLPGDFTIHDIEYLSIWCIRYRENFGHVIIPKNLQVPPALGQTKLTTVPPRLPKVQDPVEPPTFSSCLEFLDGKLQVSWAPDTESVIIKLSGRIKDNQYMAFGLSGAEDRSQMINGDVTVAFHDVETQQFVAEDYFLQAKSQCDGVNGVCPDRRLGGSNDVIVLGGRRHNGITTIIYRKNIENLDSRLDRPISTTGYANMIAAIGPLNQRKEANYHGGDRTGPDEIRRINFFQRDVLGCPVPLDKDIDAISEKGEIAPEMKKLKPWDPMVLKNVDVFHVKIGPTGGDRGYTAITGNPSWGLAFYVNDYLIPELVLERGKTYTFVVETGNDQTNPAEYHPFYITDSEEGGLGQNSDAQQVAYAGVAVVDGQYVPTAAGRHCRYVVGPNSKPELYSRFEDYFKTLTLECKDGNPHYLTFTVPANAPDELYYQCYTHTSLGWKIHIVDDHSGHHQFTGHAGAERAAQHSGASSLCLSSIIFLIFVRMWC
ncbi:protein Skeletor, isoforms B/C-like isoform X2 [Artemia franciscana]|uniref:protein Skeletor, isoforms B/C-like isoform X2 n=1 Tax=Artemia franciscana TaxID=6661 RepID=UPI0032DA9A82